MHFFEYKNNELYCEDIPLREIAEKVGTPLYVYSYRTLHRHFRAFENAFSDVPHIICFAVKANSNLAVMNLIANQGGGADVVSGGELYGVVKAGISPEKIVFAGVGKSREEIKFALKSDILMFNVESSSEMKLLDQIAGEMGVKARIALRVNPDIDPKTHPYISTGLKKSKFGIAIAEARNEYLTASKLKNLKVVGAHMHIGSQITGVRPFVDSLNKVKELVKQLKNRGMEIKYLDVGGGLGITYHDEEPPSPKEFADAVLPAVRDLNCTIILEPGRAIVGNAGVLVTKILYLKRTPEKNFIIVDGGMNDLIRPSLYNAYHEILPLKYNASSPKLTVDVVGPICESGDFFAKERSIPAVQEGEMLCVMSTGAYGFSMASNYNSRPRTAEVMVRDDRFEIVRDRETYEDLFRGQKIPRFFKDTKE